MIVPTSLPSQLALTPWLRAHCDATVYLDVQEDYLAGNLPQLHRMISCCDVFLPSEVEALTLAGTGNVGDAASRLKQLGPQTIVITRAEHGVLLLTGDSPPVEIAVPTVDPVDSTGAGDAFCGAFAAVHLATGDPFAAIEAAAGAARIAIGAFGIDGLLAAATARTAATQGVRR